MIQSNERARQARRLVRSLARDARVQAALVHSDEVLTARSELTEGRSEPVTGPAIALGDEAGAAAGAVPQTASPGKDEEVQILAGLKALFSNTDGVSEAVQAQALAAIAALTEEKKLVRAARAKEVVDSAAVQEVGEAEENDIETVGTAETTTPRVERVSEGDSAASWTELFTSVPVDGREGEKVEVPYYYVSGGKLPPPSLCFVILCPALTSSPPDLTEPAHGRVPVGASGRLGGHAPSGRRPGRGARRDGTGRGGGGGAGAFSTGARLVDRSDEQGRGVLLQRGWGSRADASLDC